MKLVFFFVLTISFLTTIAQNDSTQYYNKQWKEVDRQQAFYYSQFKFTDPLWQRSDFYTTSGKPHMIGTFSDGSYKKKEGLFKWYYENGAVRDSVLYTDNKRKAGWYFYENNAKKAMVTFAEGKVLQQKGWDESGNEVAGYVFEKAAEFPGGKQGWVRYLERNLNANAAANDRAPFGNYTVKLRFKVDELGVIHDVEPVTAPALCPSCVKDAIKVIRFGPNWIPAMQFNKPVEYNSIQNITYQVARN